MWIVYRHDFQMEVPTEVEAQEYCEEHPEFKYRWVD